jgi:hypothetical protein
MVRQVLRKGGGEGDGPSMCQRIGAGSQTGQWATETLREYQRLHGSERLARNSAYSIQPYTAEGSEIIFRRRSTCAGIS